MDLFLSPLICMEMKLLVILKKKTQAVNLNKKLHFILIQQKCQGAHLLILSVTLCQHFPSSSTFYTRLLFEHLSLG